MTPEWFEDLAQRLSEASQFAFFDDERSLCRDFQLARQSALDYAHSLQAALEEMRARANSEAPAAIADDPAGKQRHVA